MLKFFDLSVQHKSIEKEIYCAVRRVLEGVEFIGGNEVKKF